MKLTDEQLKNIRSDLDRGILKQWHCEALLASEQAFRDEARAWKMQVGDLEREIQTIHSAMNKAQVPLVQTKYLLIDKIQHFGDIANKARDVGELVTYHINIDKVNVLQEILDVLTGKGASQ